jgi:hypothetical protein
MYPSNFYMIFLPRLYMAFIFYLQAYLYLKVKNKIGNHAPKHK